MDKQWRPKEWKNPFTEELKIIPTMRGRTRVGEDEGTYEAGADAMLSGIVRELFERRIKVRRRRGCVELIPDEETDGT